MDERVSKPLDHLGADDGFVVTKIERRRRVRVLLHAQNRYRPFLDLNASTRMNFGEGEWRETSRRHKRSWRRSIAMNWRKLGCELTSIPSPTRKEKAIAEFILAWFAANELKAVRQCRRNEIPSSRQHAGDELAIGSYGRLKFKDAQALHDCL